MTIAPCASRTPLSPRMQWARRQARSSRTSAEASSTYKLYSCIALTLYHPLQFSTSYPSVLKRWITENPSAPVRDTCQLIR